MTSLKLLQSCALKEHNTLRRHKMKIAFFSQSAEVFEITAYVLPQFDTVVRVDLPFNPVAVLCNHQDETFIKVLLDSDSFEFFAHNLHKLSNPLTRMLLHRSLFDMVRGGAYWLAHLLKVDKCVTSPGARWKAE